MDDSCANFTKDLSNALSQDAVINKFAAMLENALKRASPTNPNKPELRTDTKGAELKPRPVDQTQAQLSESKHSDSVLSLLSTGQDHSPELMHTSTRHREILASAAQLAAINRLRQSVEGHSSIV